MKFVEMPTELQTKSIETLSLNYGMPEQIIEKDWWVSAVMRALFALPYPAATSQSHPTLKNAKVST